MLIDKIKADMATARAAQSTDVVIYSTLLGELQRNLVNSTDVVSNAQVISTVRKTIKANAQAITDVQARITAENEQAVKSYIAKMEHETSLLEVYIPAQLDVDAIKAVITENKIDSLKTGMAFLSANYTGCYDGGVASKVLREMFA